MCNFAIKQTHEQNKTISSYNIKFNLRAMKLTFVFFSKETEINKKSKL